MAKRIIKVIPSDGMHVAICRQGANPEAHVILRKTADDPAPTPPTTDSSGTTDMKFETLKAILVMDDKSKSYVATLDEAGADAFVAKSEADRAADVEKWAKDKKPAEMSEDDKKKAAEAAAAGATTATTEKTGETAGAVEKTADQLELEQTKVQLEELKKTVATLVSGQGDTALLARAEKEFRGYPGGSEAVVERLKAIAGLSEDVRKSIEGDMKIKCGLGSLFTGESGVTTLKSLDGSTAAEIEKSAEAIAKEKGISIDEARGEAITGERLLKALAEEDGLIFGP